MTNDERAVRDAHEAWIAAVNAGDLARLLTMMTDDAVFINPQQAPIGKDGFSRAYSAARRELEFRCESGLEEVVVAGEVAYARSRDALTVTPRGGGETARLAGHRLTVYRRGPDGRWLLARDAHTLSATAK